MTLRFRLLLLVMKAVYYPSKGTHLYLKEPQQKSIFLDSLSVLGAVNTSGGHDRRTSSHTARRRTRAASYVCLWVRDE